MQEFSEGARHCERSRCNNAPPCVRRLSSHLAKRIVLLKVSKAKIEKSAPAWRAIAPTSPVRVRSLTSDAATPNANVAANPNGPPGTPAATCASANAVADTLTEAQMENVARTHARIRNSRNTSSSTMAFNAASAARHVTKRAVGPTCSCNQSSSCSTLVRVADQPDRVRQVSRRTATTPQATPPASAQATPGPHSCRRGRPSLPRDAKSARVAATPIGPRRIPDATASNDEHAWLRSQSPSAPAKPSTGTHNGAWMLYARAISAAATRA